MAATPSPLVTCEALLAFTNRLVDHFAPEKLILSGSQARSEARGDSDADILVVMPFEGSSHEQRLTLLELAAPSFSVDLLLKTGTSRAAVWMGRSVHPGSTGSRRSPSWLNAPHWPRPGSAVRKRLSLQGVIRSLEALFPAAHGTTWQEADRALPALQTCL